MPPKKPYGFLAILDDILQFAADTLVDDGRLSFWMPTANDEQLEIPVPEHPCLEVVVVCVQVFRRCKNNDSHLWFHANTSLQGQEDLLHTVGSRRRKFQRPP